MPEEKTSRPLCPGGGNDRIYTPPELAELIVGHLKPSGRMLEPCRGTGSFSRLMPGCDWCELDEGRDFFELQAGGFLNYDWIITNPPFSLIYEFAEKAFDVASSDGGRVCFLAPLNQTIGLKARNAIADRADMFLSEVILVDTPPPPWPQSGFQLAAVVWASMDMEPRPVSGFVTWTDFRGRISYESSRPAKKAVFRGRKSVKFQGRGAVAEPPMCITSLQ